MCWCAVKKLLTHSLTHATPNWGSRHPFAPYYSLLIYWPRRDERLSWPGWLTYSRQFAHISGHLSSTGWPQDRESSPAKDRHSTTVPHNHVTVQVVVVVLVCTLPSELWQCICSIEAPIKCWCFVKELITHCCMLNLIKSSVHCQHTYTILTAIFQINLV